MAGIDHALEGIPRYAGFKYIKKERAETSCVFRRSFRLFAALFSSPSSGGSKFFLFFNNFFPQSHTHTNALYSSQQQTEDPEYSKPPRYTCFARRSVCSRPGKSPGIIKAKEEREQKLFSLFFFSFCRMARHLFFYWAALCFAPFCVFF